MKLQYFVINIAFYVCVFVELSCAAVLQEPFQDAKEILGDLTGLYEKSLQMSLTCPDSHRSFFGLEFALSGYNILNGFPKEGGRDPGWCSPIFQANFEEDRFTSDCSYKLPAGIDIQRTVACSTSFTSKETKTAQEFESQLETSASVSGGGWGASFSASASYNEAMKEMRDEAAVFVMSEARCLYYTAILQPGTPPPLSQAFLTYIRELETDDSREKYFEFFEHYGTHFVKTIDYGARFTRTHQMTQSTYQHMSNSGFSVEAAASYEGSFSVSGSLSLTASQREAVNQFRQGVTTKVSTLGALPNADGDHNQWASEVKDTPAPIVYTLNAIEDLFTSRYFQGVSGVDYDKIRQNIIRYKMKNEYCETYLKARNPEMSCDIVMEPTCTLPHIEYGSLVCKTPSGRIQCLPGDGDICELTCDAGLFVVEWINPIITCSAFGMNATFDKVPSCKKYDVMHKVSPLGDYRLTYNDAVALCDANGARLATYDELLAAFYYGLQHCTCGIVQESAFDTHGHQAIGFYPMQQSIDGCGNNIGINSCGWGDRTWNAWCHLQR